MHRDIIIATAWAMSLPGLLSKVNWVTAAAVSASVATALYFGTKFVLLVWDRIKGKQTTDNE